MKTSFTDNWTVQLRKGILELCILNSLHSSRLYGYDIVRKLRQVEGLVIGEGTIYPILSRLKRETFVETSVEESPEGPPRKYYELTDLGRHQLCRMNTEWEVLWRGIESLRQEGA